MTPHMLDLVRAVSWHTNARGPVLEIGSYIEANQEHLDMRQAFPCDTKYVGVDVLNGPGVDVAGDLFNDLLMQSLVDEIKPHTVLCLYVLEHVWDIKRAAVDLADLWQRNPESWLWVATHQNQPYHGTSNYPDYWRVTPSAMQRLFADRIEGVHILVHPDTTNPSDVVAIRQPASMPWPSEAIARAFKAVSAHWEQVS